jgi:exopolysaccharide biosynthesis protein
VAEVRIPDATYFKSAFAKNKFGSNVVEDTSRIARANNAILAINGDFYGFRRTGLMVRNGVSYMNQPRRTAMAVFRDGTMRLVDEKTTDTEELLAAGVWNTASFGPALLDGGVVVPGIDKVEVDTNIGNRSIQGPQPRAGVGMIAPNHFLFIVADGRASGYSRGVRMKEFAEIFRSHGARVAYNLDGGRSATLVFNGRVVNNPVGKGDERPTSDIFYVPSALDPPVP